MVISDNRKIIKLKIVYIQCIALLDCLFDKLVDNGIGLPAAWCSQYHCCSKNIYKINKSVVGLSFIPKFSWQIDGILVFQEKEYGAHYGRNDNLPPCNFMFLYSLVAHAGQTEKKDTKQFCVKQR